MVPRANKNAAAAPKDAPLTEPVARYDTAGRAEVPPSYDVDPTPEIYDSLNKVHHQLCNLGISKDQHNKHQGFHFRGIDDVYNVISGLLADAGIVTAPYFSDRVVTERKTNNGGVMFNVSVLGTYSFISTKDGSSIEAATYGEASDSGDKATAKAMAVAHKYAHFQLFNIPIEGRPEDRDPDFISEEVGDRRRPTSQSNRAPTKEQQPALTEEPAGEAAMVTDHPAWIKICELIPSDEKRKKAEAKLLDAYGVMLLDDIPEARWPESVAKVEAYIKAQAERAKATAKK